jgi:Flp pilus assembly protein TadB
LVLVTVTKNIESQAVESQPLLVKRSIDKVLSTRNELYAPLLSSDEEQERQATEEHSTISAAINAAASLAMDTTPGENTDSTTMSPPSGSHRLLNRFLNMSSAADALPFLLKIIVTSGKTSCFVFLGVYLILVLLWLPFWLMAKLITEIGVYAFMVVSIFFFGRCIIRYVYQNRRVLSMKCCMSLDALF